MGDLGRQIGERAQAAASTVAEQTRAEIAREEARADGSCSNPRCRLAYAHSGPCDERAQAAAERRLRGVPILRLGRHCYDIVYRQLGDEPSNDDPRVAIFTGPDAEAHAAAYVAMANGGAR